MSATDVVLGVGLLGILLVFMLPAARFKRGRESPRGEFPVVGKSLSRLHLHGEVLSITNEPVHVVPCLTAAAGCEREKFPIDSWDQGGAWL
jgi:hypothetical protein